MKPFYVFTLEQYQQKSDIQCIKIAQSENLDYSFFIENHIDKITVLALQQLA